MLTVVGTSIGYIFKRDRWIHTKPLGNGLQPVWPESSFSVNVNSLGKKKKKSQNTELSTTQRQQSIQCQLLTFPSAPPSEMGIWQVTHKV